eukprot:1724093-Rhodomonas_salina.1
MVVRATDPISAGADAIPLFGLDPDPSMIGRVPFASNCGSGTLAGSAVDRATSLPWCVNEWGAARGSSDRADEVCAKSILQSLHELVR